MTVRRILHVCPSLDPAYGGPVTALAGLAEAQIDVGLDVRILATNNEPQNRVTQRMTEHGIDVRVLAPGHGPLLWHRDIKRVTRELVSVADVVHIHTVWEEIQHQAARAARVFGKPYLFRPCGMLDPWSLRKSRWKKALYLAVRLRRDLAGAAALHFTTEEERDLARPAGVWKRSIVEPNGVSMDSLSRKLRGNFRRQYGIEPNRVLVLFLGRVHPKKGLELLMRSLAGVTAEYTLAIVGPGEDSYVLELRQLAAGYGINAVFTGMLQGDLRIAAFQDADLFVLPSSQENFANAVIEALACGVPVIVSDQVNTHKSIRHAQVGAVVKLDASSLTCELNRWIGDRHLREMAGASATKFVAENYDWSTIAHRWRGHYEALCSAKRGTDLSRRQGC